MTAQRRLRWGTRHKITLLKATLLFAVGRGGLGGASDAPGVTLVEYTLGWFQNTTSTPSLTRQASSLTRLQAVPSAARVEKLQPCFVLAQGSRTQVLEEQREGPEAAAAALGTQCELSASAELHLGAVCPPLCPAPEGAVVVGRAVAVQHGPRFASLAGSSLSLGLSMVVGTAKLYLLYIIVNRGKGERVVLGRGCVSQSRASAVCVCLFFCERVGSCV